MRLLLVLPVLTYLLTVVGGGTVKSIVNTVPQDVKTSIDAVPQDVKTSIDAVPQDIETSIDDTLEVPNPDTTVDEDTSGPDILSRLDVLEGLLTTLSERVDEEFVSVKKEVNRLSSQSYQVEQLLQEPSVDSAIECYSHPNGFDYRGSVSTTVGNHVCQKWTDQQPHSHSFTDDLYQYAGLGNHNYCRNPDGASRPWCFTTDIEARTEYCDVGEAQESCQGGITIQGGSTYVRYGRLECPNPEDLVYKGFVGGTQYTSPGGGTQFLCMPPDPIYDEVEPNVQSARAYLYHAAYRMEYGSLAYLNNHDPPCAVCRIGTRSTVIMVPGRNVCPDDTWTKEYHGYLVSARNTYVESEYVCLDHDAQPLPDTISSTEDNTRFFQVESRCVVGGSMPCGPYVDGYELTCAVCSK